MIEFGTIVCLILIVVFLVDLRVLARRLAHVERMLEATQRATPEPVQPEPVKPRPFAILSDDRWQRDMRSALDWADPADRADEVAALRERMRLKI